MSELPTYRWTRAEYHARLVAGWVGEHGLDGLKEHFEATMTPLNLGHALATAVGMGLIPPLTAKQSAAINSGLWRAVSRKYRRAA